MSHLAPHNLDDIDEPFAEGGKTSRALRGLLAVALAAYSPAAPKRKPKRSRRRSCKKPRPTFAQLCHAAGWTHAELVDAGYGAQAGIALDAERRIAVFAYRGSSEGWDWLLDLAAAIPWHWKRHPKGIRCGLGFAIQAERLWPHVAPIATVMRDRGWKIIHTGHSLGGAVAQNMALALDRQRPDMVAFESPRVWTRQGRDWIRDTILGNRGRRWVATINVRHRRADMVTRLPRWMKHAADLIVFGANGTIHTGVDAVEKWHEVRGPYISGLPTARIFSRLGRWLWRHVSGPVVSHLGRSLLERRLELTTREDR